MLVATAAEAREADRVSSETFGISSEELMRRAAKAAFRVVQTRFPTAKTVVVLAGPGNNGGDARLLAHVLAAEGRRVSLVSVGQALLPASPEPPNLTVAASSPDTPLPYFREFDLAVD